MFTMKKEKNIKNEDSLNEAHKETRLSEILTNPHLYCLDTLNHVLRGNPTPDEWKYQQVRIKGSLELVERGIEAGKLMKDLKIKF